MIDKFEITIRAVILALAAAGGAIAIAGGVLGLAPAFATISFLMIFIGAAAIAVLGL